MVFQREKPACFRGVVLIFKLPMPSAHGAVCTLYPMLCFTFFQVANTIGSWGRVQIVATDLFFTGVVLFTTCMSEYIQWIIMGSFLRNVGTPFVRVD